ncbi:MAG: M48 family metallopeptidase [Pirellulales bacterium]
MNTVMRQRRQAIRRVFVFAICLIMSVRCLYECPAQEPRKGQLFPFVSREMEAQFEQFADQMFRQPTAAEREAIASVVVKEKDERDFGKPIVEAYTRDLERQGTRLVKHGRDVEYLRQLVALIRPKMRQAARYESIQVLLADSNQIDARTFPGGTIVFHKGLLSFAESEAALVGIVGHELSHLDCEHLLLPLKRGKLLEAAGERNAGDWQKQLAGTLFAVRSLSRPFRPEDEAEADRDGAAWALAAGYDPRELARLFDRMSRKNPTPKVPFANFFRSHPYNDERRDAIEDEYRKAASNDDLEGNLYVGRKNLAQRVPRSEREFPE